MEGYPPFSWSWSRSELLDTCARAYYHRYYSGHGGYSRSATPLARRAYALKHLTTLELTLGSAIHECAAKCARACRDRAPLPTMHELREFVRSRLNTVALARDPVTFLNAPRRRPMLAPVYYHGLLSDVAIACTKARMEACLENVVASPVWGELRGVDPSRIVIPDEPACVNINEVVTYLVPDLVYYRDGWVIVDWKTGRPRDSRMQAWVYGLFIEHVLGVSDKTCTAHVHNLLVGHAETYEIGDAELEQARAFIRGSVGRMQELLRNCDSNEPLDIGKFTPARNPTRCTKCNFLELCADELGLERLL
jgi:hypothetical protein